MLKTGKVWQSFAIKVKRLQNHYSCMFKYKCLQDHELLIGLLKKTVSKVRCSRHHVSQGCLWGDLLTFFLAFLQKKRKKCGVYDCWGPVNRFSLSVDLCSSSKVIYLLPFLSFSHFLVFHVIVCLDLWHAAFIFRWCTELCSKRSSKLYKLTLLNVFTYHYVSGRILEKCEGVYGKECELFALATKMYSRYLSID